jgi:type IV secretory pathway component VirB8
MVLTKQLGEEDTDEIAQLLQEWDADKVTHPNRNSFNLYFILFVIFILQTLI